MYAADGSRVKKYGRSQQIVHTVQLLEWAYQKKRRKRIVLKKNRIKDLHVKNLSQLVDAHSILYHKEDLLAYDCDGFTIHRHLPKAVLFPKIRKKFLALLNTAMNMTCLFLQEEQAQD